MLGAADQLGAGSADHTHSHHYHHLLLRLASNNPGHAIPQATLIPQLHTRPPPLTPGNLTKCSEKVQIAPLCQYEVELPPPLLGNCYYLHGVGVPQTVLVAVVELLHVAEGLERHVEDRQGGSSPPHLLLPGKPLVRLPASNLDAFVPPTEAGHHLTTAHLRAHLTSHTF